MLAQSTHLIKTSMCSFVCLVYVLYFRTIYFVILGYKFNRLVINNYLVKSL